MPSTPVLQNFATVSFPLLSGNPNYTQQRAVSPYLVAHLPIFFANFFGDEFATVLSHHIPQQCSPCAITGSLLGARALPDADGGDDIVRAPCRSPCPARQIAWWFRGADNRESLLPRIPIPTVTAAGFVPAPEFRFSHPHTKPLHFPGDLSTALQYPVLFLQKMDHWKA